MVFNINTIQMENIFKINLINIIGAIILVSMIGSSCSKDPLLPHQIDSRELEVSFFQFENSTIVLSEEEFEQLIVYKTSEEIVLRKSELLDSISLNSVIMTPLYTPYENTIFRKINEIIDQGSEVKFITSPATLEQAFTSYYYDTQKPEVVSYRNSYDIANIINSPYTGAALAAVEALISYATGGKIDPDIGVNIEGSIDFSMIHPHAHFAFYMDHEPLYTQLLIQIGGSEDTGPNEIMEILEDAEDEDNDGTADIIETFYNSDPSDDMSYPNIKKIKLNDFRIADLSMTIPIDIKESKFDIEEDLKKDTGAISQKIAQFKLADDLPDISTNLPNFKYIPAVGLAFPIGGINIVMFGRAKMNIKVSADILFKLATLENLDIEFGYLDWTNQTAEADFIITNQAGNLIESTDLYELFDADLQTILKCEGKGEVGVGLGVAAVIGEPNIGAGIALGGYLYPHLYLDAKASLAIAIDDVFSERESETAFLDNAYLSGCLDIGMAMDAYLFFDVEMLPDGFTVLGDFNNIFDVQKKAYSVKKQSFMSYLLGEPEAKLCFPRACSNGEVKRFDISSIPNGLNFSIDVENFGTGLFDIEIFAEFGELIHKFENLEYNTPYTLNLTDQDKTSKIIQQRNNLTFKRRDKTQNCSIAFTNVSFQLDCVNNQWNPSSGVQYFGAYGNYVAGELSNNYYSFTQITPSGIEIGYFTKQDAAQVCSNIGGRLPFFNELTTIFNESNCFVPSGYIVPSSELLEYLDNEDIRNINLSNIPDNVLINEVDRIVSWVADTGDRNIFYHDVLTQNEVLEDVNPDEFSFYAPCICVK